MDFLIRLEREGDYRIVEELTREAFWNLYVPGCNEHLLMHKLRKSPDFIPELDFVGVEDGRIIAHIAYSKSCVIDGSGTAHPVITFGPVSVLPAWQKQGFGGALIEHANKAAADMGHGAVVIYGDPGYYHRFGFKSAKEFGIQTRDGEFRKALMALELYPGALRGVRGCFFESPAFFELDQEELELFDKGFPVKEKQVTDTQRAFLIMSNAVE